MTYSKECMSTIPDSGPEKSPEQHPLLSRRAEREIRTSRLLDQYRDSSPEDTATRDKIKAVFEAMFEQAEQTEPDTGFYNKKGLAAELPRLIELAERTGKPLSILFLDGYKVKRVNEKINYDAGTQVILTMAHAISASTRKSDVQARINPEDIASESTPEEDLATRPGGDEFVVILFGSDQFQAAEVAERIQKKISEIAPDEIPFYKETFKEDFTVRAGLVQYDSSVDKNYIQFLRRADEALNAAKKEPIPGMICVSNYIPDSGVNKITSLKGLHMQFPGLSAQEVVK